MQTSGRHRHSRTFLRRKRQQYTRFHNFKEMTSCTDIFYIVHCIVFIEMAIVSILFNSCRPSWYCTMHLRGKLPLLETWEPKTELIRGFLSGAAFNFPPSFSSRDDTEDSSSKSSGAAAFRPSICVEDSRRTFCATTSQDEVRIDAENKHGHGYRQIHI